MSSRFIFYLLVPSVIESRFITRYNSYSLHIRETPTYGLYEEVVLTNVTVRITQGRGQVLWGPGKISSWGLF